MKHIDVANGDADGLCALHQLRLAEAGEASLITGLKRDIALLARVHANAGDLVTVCDISLDTNREALMRLLERGVRVRYFDHHYAGEIPAHPGLEAHIDTAAGVCTSLLVDQYLKGRQRAWAVVAAFGDGMGESARAAAKSLSSTETELDSLRELGEAINYNAYGESLADLLITPVELYRLIAPYRDPLDCLVAEPLLQKLRHARREDLAHAAAVAPCLDTPWVSARILPAEAWSRRVSGEFANQLAASDPRRGHAIMTPLSSGGYSVSVRAPRGHAAGVAALCRQFPTGGGRQQAGGINHLPNQTLEGFLERFAAYFGPNE